MLRAGTCLSGLHLNWRQALPWFGRKHLKLSPRHLFHFPCQQKASWEIDPGLQLGASIVLSPFLPWEFQWKFPSSCWEGQSRGGWATETPVLGERKEQMGTGSTSRWGPRRSWESESGSRVPLRVGGVEETPLLCDLLNVWNGEIGEAVQENEQGFWHQTSWAWIQLVYSLCDLDFTLSSHLYKREVISTS